MSATSGFDTVYIATNVFQMVKRKINTKRMSTNYNTPLPRVLKSMLLIGVSA